MKKTLVFLICLFLINLSFAQKEIVNGVVIDKQAQKIVEAVSKKITTDSPILISYTMAIKAGNKTLETQQLHHHGWIVLLILIH